MVYFGKRNLQLEALVLVFVEEISYLLLVDFQIAGSYQVLLFMAGFGNVLEDVIERAWYDAALDRIFVNACEQKGHSL